MARSSLRPLLAVLAGLLSCTVLGKVSTSNNKSLVMYSPICRAIPGLTRSQINFCLKQPQATLIALQGLKQSIKECHHQFNNDRWNCSSFAVNAKNPFTNAIYQRGLKETAFAHAISSAAVTISIARACSQGLLNNCSCIKKSKYKMSSSKTWKWQGCNDYVHYGMKLARLFLDMKEKESPGDLHSDVNLHNNKVGRKVVEANMVTKCKCHGVSGSCGLETCWKVVPAIRVVGAALKEKYRSATYVTQSNSVYQNNGNSRRNKKKQRKQRRSWTPYKVKQKRSFASDLIYYEKSPSFCEKDQSLNVSGTSGRSCNSSISTESSESCASMCCGRGYNQIKKRQSWNCECKFTWCCEVECKNCTSEEWISVCK